MASKLAWAFNKNEYTLLYCILECSVKLSKVTFPDSDVAIKYSVGSSCRGSVVIESYQEQWGCGFDPWPHSAG